LAPDLDNHIPRQAKTLYGFEAAHEPARLGKVVLGY
jgi:hypothetical protein